jgi:hypothetical protein
MQALKTKGLSNFLQVHSYGYLRLGIAQMFNTYGGDIYSKAKDVKHSP